MSKVFFISDLHLGHKNAINWRTEFKSPEEHDSLIYKNILKCAGKRNILWLLGDCFMHESTLGMFHEIRRQFDQVHMVLGNHDTDKLARQLYLFDILEECTSAHGLHKRYGAWLSHAPIHPQELRGKFNIHGHVHTNTVPDPRYVNVSAEMVDYKPITLEDVRRRVQYADFRSSVQ